MDIKERLLSNPHITLDAKRLARMNVEEEKIEPIDIEEGPAIELPPIETPLRQEVVTRKRKKRASKPTTLN